MMVILGYLPLPWELANNWKFPTNWLVHHGWDPHFFEGQIRNLHGRLPTHVIFWRSKWCIWLILGTNSEGVLAELVPPL